MNTRRHWAAAALGIVLLVGAGLTVTRGLYRGVTQSLDFTMIYAGARQVAHGQNPYLFEEVYESFREGGGANERPRDPKWFASLYPPTTYALLAPVGALPWRYAQWFWTALNCLGWGFAGWWAWRWRPKNGGDPAHEIGQKTVVISLVAGLLIWGPMHTTLAFGQLGGVVVGLVVLAVGRPPALGASARTPGQTHAWAGAGGGLALALACCIKPQLAGLFVVWAVAAGRIGLALWSIIWSLIVIGGSVWWLQYKAPTWSTDLRHNLATFVGTGFADPTPANNYAYQMINLQPLVHRFIDHSGMANVASVVLGGGLLLATFFILRTAAQRYSPQALLRALGLVAVATLLVTYHRTYDAVLLLFPAVWAWQRLVDQPRSRAGWFAVAGLAVFVFPLAAALGHAVGKDVFPSAWINSAWWWPVVMFHQTWALLAIGLALVLSREPRRVLRPTPCDSVSPQR